MDPESALVACRFLQSSAAILIWGGLGFVTWCTPATLAADLERRLVPWSIVAIAIAIGSTLAKLPLLAATIGNGWLDSTNPSTILSVLFDTTPGQAWLVQAVIAALLFVVLLVAGKRRAAALASVAGLMLASFGLSGHAVMHEGWRGILHPVNDALHVLAAGAWIGALLPLYLVLKGLKDFPGADIRTALIRFSLAGQIAVSLVVVSGLVNTLLILGHLPSDFSSPYQAMLLAKIALVGMMIVLALINRYRFVPHADLRSVKRGTVAEIVLGLCVIGLVSCFGTLDPV